MSILLGAIADDFTGATDLANTLVGQGMPTVQSIGVPGPDFCMGKATAVVVALKSRTKPAADAIEESLTALEWLQSRGAKQIFFKYCSTFDSTDEGNIGCVADALMGAMNVPFTIACPAYPVNQRTIYKGYLYAGDILLSESGMKDHPLTPMTDPNIVRVLSRQTEHNVGLIDITTVEQGATAINHRFKKLREEGFRYAVVDALKDSNLKEIGKASADLKLITGGSGIALGLPENFRNAGLLPKGPTIPLPDVKGRAAILAGSCSIATRKQVEKAKSQFPTHFLDPMKLSNQTRNDISATLAWIDRQSSDKPLLIYSSADPNVVTQAQKKHGREKAGALVERAMGLIARGLIQRGVRKIVVAGGETAGAVVQALGITGLKIGPEIDPGVPWTETVNEPRIALALKSGNFGKSDFFIKSLDMLK